MINEQTLKEIEKALDIKLYPNQVDYLLNNGHLGRDRASGRTVAFCIDLALSEGEPLDMSRCHEFSDMQHLPNRMSYAKHFFRPEFLRIRHLLQQHGLKVRDIMSQKPIFNADNTVTVKLDKRDLISIVMGQEPNYSEFDNPLIKPYGKYYDNNGWSWSEAALLELELEILFKMYTICKHSWK